MYSSLINSPHRLSYGNYIKSELSMLSLNSTRGHFRCYMVLEKKILEMCGSRNENENLNNFRRDEFGGILCGRSIPWIYPVTMQISLMWVLCIDLVSPEDYQIGHMMNQVSLNYLIHLMLDIPCYICTTDDCSKL